MADIRRRPLYVDTEMELEQTPPSPPGSYASPRRPTRVVVECDGMMLKTVENEWCCDGPGGEPYCEVIVDLKAKKKRAVTPTDNYIESRCDGRFYDVENFTGYYQFDVIVAYILRTNVAYLVVKPLPRPSGDLTMSQLVDVQRRFDEGEGTVIPPWDGNLEDMRDILGGKRIACGPWTFTRSSHDEDSYHYTVNHASQGVLGGCMGGSVLKCYNVALGMFRWSPGTIAAELEEKVVSVNSVSLPAAEIHYWYGVPKSGKTTEAHAKYPEAFFTSESGGPLRRVPYATTRSDRWGNKKAVVIDDFSVGDAEAVIQFLEGVDTILFISDAYIPRFEDHFLLPSNDLALAKLRRFPLVSSESLNTGCDPPPSSVAPRRCLPIEQLEAAARNLFPVAATPPAPRLVNVELHPGPSPCVALTTEEIRKLPLDVIVEHLVPLLSQQPPPSESVDVWASRMLEWVTDRAQVKVVDLPEYHAAAGFGKYCSVDDVPLAAFTTFGPEDVPFSVYAALDHGNPEQIVVKVGERSTVVGPTR